MTNAYPDRDRQAIDQLLAEADMEDAVDLRPVLLELRSLAAGTPPMPSAELAALMAAGPVSLHAPRRIRHRRMIVAALAVAASIGVGAAAAAASPEFRDTAQKAIAFLIHTFIPGTIQSPAHPGVPAPASTHTPATPTTPSGTTRPTPSDVPSATPSTRPTGPARPGPTQTVPGQPTPGTPPANPPARSQNGNTPEPLRSHSP
ncbi:MAG: hypothetical protein ACYCZY_09785 [Lacisediminihabitans sp.]